jgi:hypothetical protein
MIEVTQDIVAQARIIEGTKKYKKLPIEIEAYQMDEHFVVNTLEGQMMGNKGDYVVVGIRGELYPCNKEIFESSYVRVY